jgi:hypothetical protein
MKDVERCRKNMDSRFYSIVSLLLAMEKKKIVYMSFLFTPRRVRVNPGLLRNNMEGILFPGKTFPVTGKFFSL